MLFAMVQDSVVRDQLKRLRRGTEVQLQYGRPSKVKVLATAEAVHNSIAIGDLSAHTCCEWAAEW